MSSANNSNSDWECSMLLLYGNSFPVWTPTTDSLKPLLDYVKVAKPWEASFEVPPATGYHGVVLRNGEQTITAFKGRMEIKTGAGTVLKTDLGRKLEQMILLQAPEKYKSIALNQLTTDFD
jgi:hypothetical protein